MIKTLVSWSCGKDSAWALHLLRRQPDTEIAGLLTTVNTAYERVTMHGVRVELMRAQARAVGVAVNEVRVPHPCSESEYADAMRAALATAAQDGIRAVAFGDLFLEDVRRYREERMRGTGIEPVFPLWGLMTHALAEDLIDAGTKARVTCIDPNRLDASFAGREWDRSFLSDLPRGVDPCGENGEYHTFVYDGPMFQRPVPVEAGVIVERDGFVFADFKLTRSSP